MVVRVAVVGSSTSTSSSSSSSSSSSRRAMIMMVVKSQPFLIFSCSHRKKYSSSLLEWTVFCAGIDITNDTIKDEYIAYNCCGP